MKNVYSGKMRLDEWGKFFVEFIFPDDLNEEVSGPFFKYLADLAVLIPCDDDRWKWREIDSAFDLKILKDTVRKDLESLCSLESGFALPYFIGYKDIPKKPLKFDHEPDLFAKGSFEKTGSKKHSAFSQTIKPASNLSNLQIVKKVGKQLQPFLQIEESIVSRLTGRYLSKQDAQKLFHFIFAKMGTKAEPRVWEQLSRKRHR
jgi:hypothetical protein